jgi:hypothetical protein
LTWEIDKTIGQDMVNTTKNKKLLAKTRKKARIRPVVQPKTQREIGLLGKALRGLGGLGGSALGGMFGMAAPGAAVGNSLGASLSKWLGAGDYTVGQNSIVGRTLKGTDSIPDMHRNGQSVVVQHKEYLGEVRSNTAFTIQQSYPLNPGMATTFPWLYKIANRFQEYRFKGIVFHYVPSSGSAIASTNNALGTVMLQTSYRSNDTAPASKVEMLNEYWSSESTPNEAFCHPIECDPDENPFNIQYVRGSAVPSGDNQLIYDLGQTHLAVSGQQASNVVLGDLWITYEVELKKPLIDSNATDDIQAINNTYTSPTGSTWFGTLSNTLGTLGVTTDAVRTVSFPKGSVGQWLLVYRWVAQTAFTAWNTDSTVTLTNCGTFAFLDPVGVNSKSSMGGTASTDRAYFMQAITIADPAVVATVAFGAVTITGTATQGFLTITRIN